MWLHSLLLLMTKFKFYATCVSQYFDVEKMLLCYFCSCVQLLLVWKSLSYKESILNSGKDTVKSTSAKSVYLHCVFFFPRRGRCQSWSNVSFACNIGESSDLQGTSEALVLTGQSRLWPLHCRSRLFLPSNIRHICKSNRSCCVSGRRDDNGGWERLEWQEQLEVRRNQLAVS